MALSLDDHTRIGHRQSLGKRGCGAMLAEFGSPAWIDGRALGNICQEYLHFHRVCWFSTCRMPTIPEVQIGLPAPTEWQ